MTENQEHISIFAPYLKHRGYTVEEQIKLNQPAMEWLKQRFEEEITEEEAKKRQEDWERLKEIIDSFRPEGHKLFRKLCLFFAHNKSNYASCCSTLGCFS